MCVCVWCMSQSKDEKLRAQVFFFVIIFFSRVHFIPPSSTGFHFNWKKKNIPEIPALVLYLEN